MALSDVERSQTYEFCGTPTLPMTGFRATLRINEIVDGKGAFAEWWANFDFEPARSEELCATLRGWFGRWLESLRTQLAAQGSPELARAEHEPREAKGFCPVSG